MSMSSWTRMVGWWLPSAERKYLRIDTSDGTEDEEASQNRYDWRMVRIVEAPFDLGTIFLVCMITAVSAGTLGFFAGRHLPPLFPSDFLPAPAGTINQTWQYNRTFSDPPSPINEAAWLSIFPKGRGFFSHPSLDVNISGIAVFHELHCLSGIRLAYYDALNATSQAHSRPADAEFESDIEDAKIDAANMHDDPHHVRHCFDYLRQALMCAADTNLEVIDWSIGGSTGWGFERQCRDYERVVDWAEKWRYHSQRKID